MDNQIWKSPPHSAGPRPPIVERLVEAVARGRLGALFPPTAVEIDRYASGTGRLSGEPAAGLLAAALTAPEFGPFLSAVEQVAAWGRGAAGDRGDIAPAALSLDNDSLHGPALSELFTVCAAGRLPDPVGFCHRRITDWLAHLDDFRTRLRADRPALERSFGLSGPVVALTAEGHETHNAGRRVLRVTTADGGSVAYKTRPACGEALFLGADTGTEDAPSVFALLNRLTGAPEIELPTMTCLSRDTGASGWLWQEWIEPAPRRPVHSEHGLTVTGPVLEPGECHRFWRRAGALTAASVAFGIADLPEGNLLAGRRRGDSEPRYYIVDLEVFGRPVDHLHQTGLTAEPGRHHVGFEDRPRLCVVDPPPVYLRQSGTGLELSRLDRPWTRGTTDTVVGDAAGRFGYGPHLPHFLRGAFDLWAVVCQNRERIADYLHDRTATTLTRVLPRDTDDYGKTLTRWLLHGEAPPPDYAASEISQLAAGDVPYYFAAPHDARLRTVDGPVDEPALSDDQLAPDRLSGSHWDLGGLAMTLRGALEYAAPAQPRSGVGIRTGACEVAVDWPEFDTRLLYTWDTENLRLRAGELTEPEPLSEVAERLRRIDHVDGWLRTAWVDGGRSDPELTGRLAELGTEAISWLEGVVDEHGWPTMELVGAEAADAAVRLLQHVDGALEFRHRCLRELTAAARAGRASLPHVAYVTDALRLAEGLPQRYGTKFERRDGELVPCELADPDGIDAARAAMGLSSLDEYAARIRDRFGTVARPADHSTGAAS